MRVLVLSLLFLSHAVNAHAQELINLSAVMQVESHGDPRAQNRKSGAIGLFQITQVCRQEWNDFHPTRKYQTYRLFEPHVNTEIATWYLRHRIPQMLKHFRKPVTTRNILISYNAGVLYVVSGKPLPQETLNYLQKYAAQVS